VIAVVLNFTFLMAYKPSHPADMVGSSALSGADANANARPNADQQQLSIPKPLPGKSAAPAEAGSALPKPLELGTKALRRERAKNVEYIGDDVTVRRFTDTRSTKRSREPNGRIAHIGDDVTVRYFASPPPARTATR
jgi:hypothetical protein